MKYAIVPATQEHVEQMLPNIRRDDRHEVMATYGKPVEDLLGKCVGKSEMAWAGLADDDVVCIFGVVGATVLSETGHPWMIGTSLIDKHARVFLLKSRDMVSEMQFRYRKLENFVDVRNKKSIKWLGWLGFQFAEPAPYGIYRMPFMKFTKEV